MKMLETGEIVFASASELSAWLDVQVSLQGVTVRQGAPIRADRVQVQTKPARKKTRKQAANEDVARETLEAYLKWLQGIQRGGSRGIIRKELASSLGFEGGQTGAFGSKTAGLARLMHCTKDEIYQAIDRAGIGYAVAGPKIDDAIARTLDELGQPALDDMDGIFGERPVAS